MFYLQLAAIEGPPYLCPANCPTSCGRTNHTCEYCDELKWNCECNWCGDCRVVYGDCDCEYCANCETSDGAGGCSCEEGDERWYSYGDARDFYRNNNITFSLSPEERVEIKLPVPQTRGKRGPTCRSCSKPAVDCSCATCAGCLGTRTDRGGDCKGCCRSCKRYQGCTCKECTFCMVPMKYCACVCTMCSKHPNKCQCVKAKRKWKYTTKKHVARPEMGRKFCPHCRKTTCLCSGVLGIPRWSPEQTKANWKGMRKGSIQNYSANPMRYCDGALYLPREASRFTKKWVASGITSQVEPMFGVEIETKVVGYEGDMAKACNHLHKNLFTRTALAKSDSSLKNEAGEMCRESVEIVTVHGTLAYHQEEMWKEFEKVSTRFRSHNLLSYGMHIHISRNAFTLTGLSKFVQFFNNPLNFKFIRAVVQRNNGAYARLRSDYLFNLDVKGQSDKMDERMQAVNLGGDKPTVELRLFNGTTNVDSIKASIEFVHSVWNYTNQPNGTRKLSFAHYLEWLLDPGYKKKYPHLYAMLCENKALMEAEFLAVSHTNEYEDKEYHYYDLGQGTMGVLNLVDSRGMFLPTSKDVFATTPYKSQRKPKVEPYTYSSAVDFKKLARLNTRAELLCALNQDDKMPVKQATSLILMLSPVGMAGENLGLDDIDRVQSMLALNSHGLRDMYPSNRFDAHLPSPTQYLEQMVFSLYEEITMSRKGTGVTKKQIEEGAQANVRLLRQTLVSMKKNVVSQFPQVITELKGMSKQFDVLSDFGYYIFKDILPFLNTVIDGLSQALDKPLEDKYWSGVRQARRERYTAHEGEIHYILDKISHIPDGESRLTRSDDDPDFVSMGGIGTRPSFGLYRSLEQARSVLD